MDQILSIACCCRNKSVVNYLVSREIDLEETNTQYIHQGTMNSVKISILNVLFCYQTSPYQKKGLVVIYKCLYILGLGIQHHSSSQSLNEVFRIKSAVFNLNDETKLTKLN